MMMKRSLAAGLLACAALTPVALAQGNQPASQNESKAGQSGSISFIRAIEDGQFRSTRLVGMTVYNQQDENIGDINDLILDRGGRVAGVIIGVGGFLGMGVSEVAVPMNSLKFVREDQAQASTDSGKAGNDAAASGRSAAGNAEKEPGSAGSPSGTSTNAALPNQDKPDQGNAQQNAAEGAQQAKQDPAKTGAAGNAGARDAAGGSQSAAADNARSQNKEADNAGASSQSSAEQNWLDGVKVVLNTSRDDLTEAPKLGETENQTKQ